MGPRHRLKGNIKMRIRENIFFLKYANCLGIGYSGNYFDYLC